MRFADMLPDTSQANVMLARLVGLLFIVAIVIVYIQRFVDQTGHAEPLVRAVL